MCGLILVLLFGFSINPCLINAVTCSGNVRCQCIAGFISCRAVITLPDVLDSRLYPLRNSPPVTADLRGSALSFTVLKRFLVVYGTVRRIILTDALESRCSDVLKLRDFFPHVTVESDCVVSCVIKNNRQSRCQHDRRVDCLLVTCHVSKHAS